MFNSSHTHTCTLFTFFQSLSFFFLHCYSEADTLIILSLWLQKFSAGKGSQAMFSISQPNLLANKRRKYILSCNIVKESNGFASFQWAPFPVEMTGVSTMVPSPSGSKLLVVRNSENESPTQFEIWSASQVDKEFHIPHSVHGSVYSDGW